MRKLNLLSNSRLVIFIVDDEWIEIKPEQIPELRYSKINANDGYYSIDIRPDQIPTVILDAIVNAAAGDLVLALSLFLDGTYNNYCRFIMVTWDGICAIKRRGKLFGDGSYEFEAYNDEGSVCLGIL